MTNKRSEKNRVKGDGVGGLFFQQAPLYGVHSAAAIFFITRAMVRGARLLGLKIVIAAGVLFFMVFSFMVACMGNGRMRRRHVLAVANGVEVSCEYSQQE